MQPEFLSRGKRLDNGKWVYGCFVESEHDLYHAYIITSAFWETDVDGDTDMISTEMYPVDPNTVGRYSGLTDKNGVKIFNGDIVKWTWVQYLVSTYGYVKYAPGSIFVVRKLESGFMLCNLKDNMPDVPNANGKIDNYAIWNCHRGLEVIGNIHDNPELLEVRNDAI